MSPTIALREQLGGIRIVRNLIKPSGSKDSTPWEYSGFYDINPQQPTILELPCEDVLAIVKRLNNSLNELNERRLAFSLCLARTVAHPEIEPRAKEFCEMRGIDVYKVCYLIAQSFSGLQGLEVSYSEDPEIHDYEKVRFHLIISGTTENILSNKKEFRKRLHSLFPDQLEHLVLTYHIIDESP